MPSLVPDFIINPVLRQARRFSNFATAENEEASANHRQPAFANDAILEPDPKHGLHQDAASALLPVKALSAPLMHEAEAPGLAEALPIPSHSTHPPRHFRAPSLNHQSHQPQPQAEPATEIDGRAALSSSAPARPSTASSSDIAQSLGGLGSPSPAGNRAGGMPHNHGHDHDQIQGQGQDQDQRSFAASMPTESLLSGRTDESALPAAFFGNMELPADDGMTALRRRILAVQSTDAALPEKARMIHSLLMEGYTRSRKTRLPLRPATPSSLKAAPASEPRSLEQPVSSSVSSSVFAAASAASAFASGSSVSGPLESLKFWHNSRAFTPPLPTNEIFDLTDDDLRPTYVPGLLAPPEGDGHGIPDSSQDEEDQPVLGCQHYRRKVKMQCHTCDRWYTCRLCHDEAEDHILPRRETKHMLCMLCGHAQRVGDVCAHCGALTARYYCGICKLWDDDPDTHIYHCNDCGICRVGEGLGKDFFHCKKCGSCIAIHQEDSHRCREGVMDCDCPICGEYLFTSHRKVVTMKCGHTIHDDCRAEYIKRSYKCPICNKSVENMESMFRRLDKHLAEQPMPEEYKDTRAIILCNDCEAKTSTKYHWGGLRCEVCLSYNTVELHLLNSPKSHNQPSQGHERLSSSSGGGTLRTGAFGMPLHVSTASMPLPISPPATNGTLQPPILSSTPMSSSPLSRNGGLSPPVMTFRSASPAFMTSPTTAPVIATPPPGYSAQGYYVAGDDGLSDTEHEDILGLWGADRHKLRSEARNRGITLQNEGEVTAAGAGEENGSSDESGSNESETDDDDYGKDEDDDEDEDDDDEEDPISLIGHR